MQKIFFLTMLLLFVSVTLSYSETANGRRECETNNCCVFDATTNKWYWACFMKSSRCVNYGCFLVCNVVRYGQSGGRPSMCDPDYIMILGNRRIVIDCGDDKPGYSESMTIKWCQYRPDIMLPEGEQFSWPGTEPCNPSEPKPSCYDYASITCNFAGCIERLCNKIGLHPQLLYGCFQCVEQLNIEEYFND